MRAGRLIHRATYVFVFGSDRRLYVQKRTPSKDMYPGHFDLAAGGVVLHGETYEESATRELKEELGIEGAPLRRHFDFYYEDSQNRIFGRVFSCIHDGPFVLQAEEVESGRFMPIDEARSGAVAPLTPDTAYALEELERRGVRP
jgi:8-oxo-dGTP pyrophosphatase MutT (NUDIX family)